MWPFRSGPRPGNGRRRRPEGAPRPASRTPEDLDAEWDQIGPGWRALRDRKARRAAEDRAPRPLFYACSFQRAATGELPAPTAADGPVEALLWQRTQRRWGPTGRSSYELPSSGVILFLPRPLPLLGVYPRSPYWPATTGDFPAAPKRHLRLWPVHVPGHTDTTVIVADERVYRAVTTPEVLGRPQLAGRHWQLEGHTAVAWSRGHSAPQLLHELAIDLHAVVAELSSQGLAE
ncbi:hypothetical protein [Streptomyces sp. NPDC093097]|uniref:hypothetical protein n=1 Tax=Streptomyces sp. NPDC093097 TaxID=3366027 RepID=UPI00382975FB